MFEPELSKAYESLAEALGNFSEENTPKIAAELWALAGKWGMKALQEKLQGILSFSPKGWRAKEKSPSLSREKLLHDLLEVKSLLRGYLFKKHRLLIGAADAPEPLLEAQKMMEGDFAFYFINHGSEKKFMEAAWALLPDAIILVNEKNSAGVFLLYKNLKEEGAFSNIPVLFLGKEEKIAAITALAMGALDYLPLNVDTRELAFKIKNAASLGRELKYALPRSVATSPVLARRAFCLAQLALRECREKKSPFSFLFLKMEDLLRVNISKGRPRGNLLLRLLAQAIENNLPPEGISFRCGEGEFVALFPGADPGDLHRAAEKIRADFNEKAAKHGLLIQLRAVILIVEADLLASEEKTFRELFSLARKEEAKIKKTETETRQIFLGSLEGAYGANIEEPAKILVVDNDPLIQDLLRNRFAGKGHMVYTASSGEEALKIFKDLRPAVVITEYLLPGMDGDRLAAAVKKIDKNVKVLFLSSQKLDSFIEKAIHSGADDYLKKPFSPWELDFKIERFLKE